MSPPRRKPLLRRKRNPKKKMDILAEVERNRTARAAGYREQALALFPHVCARCGREFSGKDLRELTVHHKDHNHMNNPPDGSNWELLCLYCHDYEHDGRTEGVSQGAAERYGEGAMGHHAFESLKDLVAPDEDDEAGEEE